VTIRISAERDAATDVVRVSGRLAGASALGEFLRVCESSSAALIIDLSELRFADEEALRALRSLREQGVKLLDASPYLSLLLAS